MIRPASRAARGSSVRDAASESRIHELIPVTAKRGSADSGWFDYYAGYADDFVAQMVGALADRGAPMLDPWNGAGTTTSVAAAHGMHAIGFDINPAAVLVAKAKLLQSDVADSVMPLCEEVIAAARDHGHVAASDDDLLRTWLRPTSANRIRRMERTIAHLLIPPGAGRLLSSPSLDRTSSLAAVLLLALFRAVRTTLAPFQTTNPTWFRIRVKPEDRIGVQLDRFESSFRAAAAALAQAASRNTFPTRGLASSAGLGSSTSLPLEAGTIAAAVTSPPYCTRIDYAVATAPELATLGISRQEFGKLRAEMIGTPTLQPEDERSIPSDKLEDLTTTIRKHPSYAAEKYYLPFCRQYFNGMHASLAELDRVVRDSSPVVMVVQDSFFKDVRVDTPGILAEMAKSFGWREIASHEFSVHTRAAMHPHRRAHREQYTATETIAIFET
jgi:hypothetical protein